MSERGRRTRTYIAIHQKVSHLAFSNRQCLQNWMQVRADRPSSPFLIPIESNRQSHLSLDYSLEFTIDVQVDRKDGVPRVSNSNGNLLARFFTRSLKSHDVATTYYSEIRTRCSPNGWSRIPNKNCRSSIHALDFCPFPSESYRGGLVSWTPLTWSRSNKFLPFPLRKLMSLKRIATFLSFARKLWCELIK